MAGIWGKFSGGQGGLEGRNPSPKEGFLRLQGLPLFAPTIFRRKNLTKEGILPSKPPSLTENFPQEHPPLQSEDLFRFVWGGCSWGKFFVGLGGREFLQRAAIAPDW